MNALRLGALVQFTMDDEDWRRSEISLPASVWIRRADEKHLCIVIEHLSDYRYGDETLPMIKVWDTVERDWFSAEAKFFAVSAP